MSPVLMAILAVFGCMVGVVMGRITARPGQPSKYGEIKVKLVGASRPPIKFDSKEQEQRFSQARAEYLGLVTNPRTFAKDGRYRIDPITHPELMRK